MDSSVIELGRRVNNEKNHNWEIVDLENFKMTKPIVLILGGLGTFRSSQANGYCKIVKSLLGTFNEDADVISIKYSNQYSVRETSVFLRNIVDKLFMPLISADGKKIETTEAAKNLRNITIFSHCYGSFVAKVIGDLVTEKMIELKYSKPERKKILEQIFLVSYASYTDNKDLPFKTLDITSPEDNADGMFLWAIGQEEWNDLKKDMNNVDISPDDVKEMKMLVPDENGNFHTYKSFENKERCYVYRKGNGLYLVPTHLHKKDRYDHSMLEIKRGDDWKPHANASLAGDYASKCLACALCHSVATSILNNKQKELVQVDLNTLKEELENIVRPLNGEYKKYIDMGDKSK